MKCKECEFLKAYPPAKGVRYSYEYGHENQAYINKYHQEHHLHKYPPFICYGGGRYGNEPTIKTSPAWCPLKKGGVK